MPDKRDSIQTMTIAQLGRIYSRLYVRLGDGGLYGWDLPTIAMCYPGIYAGIRRVLNEIKRRRNGKPLIHIDYPPEPKIEETDDGKDPCSLQGPGMHGSGDIHAV